MKNNKFIERSMQRKVIYVYRKKYESEREFLKIGDTSIDRPNADLTDNSKYLIKISENRIREYDRTSDIEILFCTVAITDDWIGFRDHDVHNVLVRSGFPKHTLGRSTEWFKVDESIALRAIQAVKEGRNSLSNLNEKEKATIIFRPEQEKAIKETIKVFKEKDNMLWNAKMRFGKTLSSLEVVKRMKFNKTLIITHRPIVDSSWYEDFHKIFDVEKDEYEYGSPNNGEKIENLINGKKSFVYFISIQNLRESKRVGGEYNKNNEIFDINWDFLVIDEAHEGTQTNLAKKMLSHLISNDTKQLYLSGTPFNLLDDYDENQIYTWDYVMEQEAKYTWDLENPGASNPYSIMPEMNMYVYELGETIKNNNFIDIETRSFNFHEFFREEDNKFIYEKEIVSFLNLITRSEEYSHEKTNYPFSTSDYRNELRHTLWTLPSRKSAQLLEVLLHKHPVFSHYNIANLVEDDSSSSYKNDYKKIREAITDTPEDSYSITLTVRKGTVGVTVKEWNGILVLNNTETATNYLQSIFRVQTPYSNINGFKERAYVFDFAPDRTLKMVASAAKLNIKKGSLNSNEQRKSMQKLLNFLPIIGIEGNKMRAYDIDTMLSQLKRAAAEKAVEHGFDDNSLYSDELLRMSELDLKSLETLGGIIGTTNQTRKMRDITINEQGLNDEEWEKAEEARKKPRKDRTPEEQEAYEKQQELRKQRKNVISILRGISIRIPLMIYGMAIDIDEDVTLENFTSYIDDVSWEEFMPQGVTKEIFNSIKKYYDEDIFLEAGRKIRRSALAADELSVEGRIEKITAIFSNFKNPDKETVLTPWNVVNLHLGETVGGYVYHSAQFFEDHKNVNEVKFVEKPLTQEVFSEKSKILELNSKTGLYPLFMAYTIYKLRFNKESIYWSKSEWITKDKELWDDVLENNIFVLNKTPMARTITYRTLVGYEDNEIVLKNLLYIENLIELLAHNMNKVKTELRRLAMKFDVVVGNPPYQELQRAATTGNNANTKDIFHLFQTLALEVGKINSLIYPAKNYQRGYENVMDKRLVSLRIMNGSDKETEKTIPNEPSVFGDSVRRIHGDVGIFLWNIENTEDKILYQGVKIDRTDKILPARKEFLPLAEKLEKNANKYQRINIRKSCESYFVERFPEYVKSRVEDRTLPAPKGFTKVITNDIAGSGGKAEWFYIRTDKLDFIQPNLYKVVIGSAYPNEAFKNPKNVEILNIDEMFGRTKMSLYASEKLEDAQNYVKFLNTDFVKIIAEITPHKFLYYLPNFNDVKDKIDWSKKLTEINNQLFCMYDISREESERYLKYLY